MFLFEFQQQKHFRLVIWRIFVWSFGMIIPTHNKGHGDLRVLCV